MHTQHYCATELQNVHLAATPARIETIRLFESHKKPLDAQHIIKHVLKKGIDRVTVFRNLNTFVEKGLLTKLEFGEGKARYELAKVHHHHIICESCGKMKDVQDIVPHIEEKVGNQTGFLVKRHSLEFFGLCKDCQRKEYN